MSSKSVWATEGVPASKKKGRNEHVPWQIQEEEDKDQPWLTNGEVAVFDKGGF
jgi:hypothetical protein